METLFGILLVIQGVVMLEDTSAAQSTPHFDPLPGRAVGLFIRDPRAIMATEGRTGPEGAIAFARGTKSYYWVYATTPKDPEADDLEFPIGTEKRAELFRSVRMATAKEVEKRWKLADAIHLVEVEVNGGKGTPAFERFIATAVKDVGGTEGYPLRPVVALKDAQKRYAEHLTAQRPAIQEGMARALRILKRTTKPTGPREESQTLHLTWLPDRERLRIEIRTQVSDGFYQTSKGADGPEGAEGHSGTQFGVRGGMVFEYDKQGQMVRATPIVFEPYTLELAPLP